MVRSQKSIGKFLFSSGPNGAGRMAQGAMAEATSEVI